MNVISDFERHDLGNGRCFFSGTLSAALTLSEAGFDEMWQLHPVEYHEIKMNGRTVLTPRWQQAYGADYHYTGRTNQALPTPPILEPLLTWGKEAADPRLNGVLVNWYDGELGHYIGRHRDSRVNMVPGAPIVTISFGEERIFRLRPWPHSSSKQCLDFRARHGAVFVMPFETNLHWTHEVPAFRKLKGRRISVTLRAFQTTA